MDFGIINKEEINTIVAFLMSTIKEDDSRSAGEEINTTIRHIVDNKINLIAHEIHLIMNSNNHPYNFLPHDELWEIYRNCVFNGPMIEQQLFDEQVYQLANKISDKLGVNYIKAINYIYGDLDYLEYSDDDELLINTLDTGIDKCAFNEITSVLVDIAEKERTLEYNLYAEREVQEERAEYESELYESIITLTERQKAKQLHVDQHNRNNLINPHWQQKNIKAKDGNPCSIARELADIIKFQEKKLEYYDELVQMKEAEMISCSNSAQLVELERSIKKEKKYLDILKLRETK